MQSRHTLLMFYEAIQFLRKADPSFSYQEIEDDSIGLLISYRNKLTHREENTYKGKYFASLLEAEERKIYRDINDGIENINQQHTD